MSSIGTVRDSSLCTAGLDLLEVSLLWIVALLWPEVVTCPLRLIVLTLRLNLADAGCYDFLGFALLVASVLGFALLPCALVARDHDSNSG